MEPDLTNSPDQTRYGSATLIKNYQIVEKYRHTVFLNTERSYFKYRHIVEHLVFDVQYVRTVYDFTHLT
jgi:hypothetical protein